MWWWRTERIVVCLPYCKKKISLIVFFIFRYSSPSHPLILSTKIFWNFRENVNIYFIYLIPFFISPYFYKYHIIPDPYARCLLIILQFTILLSNVNQCNYHWVLPRFVKCSLTHPRHNLLFSVVRMSLFSLAVVCLENVILFNFSALVNNMQQKLQEKYCSQNVQLDKTQSELLKNQYIKFYIYEWIILFIHIIKDLSRMYFTKY